MKHIETMEMLPADFTEKVVAECLCAHDLDLRVPGHRMTKGAILGVLQNDFCERCGFC